MKRNNLSELTVDIVAAHVSNNSVTVKDMPGLIQQVHAALAGLEPDAPDSKQVKSPVVSIRASVRPDYLTCLECGAKFKTLRRHIRSAHGMTPDQYRKDYGLSDTYPLTASNYSESRRAMAKSLRLGRKLKAGRASAS